ncbi:hypothetical protein HY251_09955, partial [bacterium]|nr:hypothetical protein [bacterium]
IKCYDDALKLDPGYFKARNNKAVSEIQQGSQFILRVYKVRDMLAHEDPNRTPAMTEKLVRAEQENTDRAMRHFHAAKADLMEILRTRPNDVSALGNIASLDFMFLSAVDPNALDEAVDYMEKSIAQAVIQNDVKVIAYAEHGDIFFFRAKARSKARKLEQSSADLLQAIKNYQEFLKRAAGDPNAKHVQARLHLAESYYKQGGDIPPDEDDGTDPQVRQGSAQGINVQVGRPFKLHSPPRPERR